MENPLGVNEQQSNCVTSQRIDTDTYAMLMHLSQFMAFFLPFLGWCIPVVLWAIRRDECIIDKHGKIIFNWIISATIYSISLLALTLILPFLSIPLFLILIIASIIFTILSAVAAKKGEITPYPLAIKIFK